MCAKTAILFYDFFVLLHCFLKKEGHKAFPCEKNNCCISNTKFGCIFQISLYLSEVLYTYWKSIMSIHLRRNSFSSSMPLDNLAAATIGIHFCTYCLAVSLFLQNIFKYNSAIP